MRATASPQRDASERGPAERWPGALLFAAAAGTVILGAYLAHPITSGYGLPVGPDGPVYVWWTRYVDAFGLAELPGGRIGVPAIALGLRPYLRTSALETVTLLGPVFAAGAGLAGAALVEVALGRSLVRATAVALLTGAFAAYLAGGWLGNTALVAVFLAAAAALALVRRSWRSVAGAAALLAAAGLTHRIAALLLLAVVVGVAAAYVPDFLRDRRAGTRLADTTAARLAIATAAGSAFAALSLVPTFDAARLPGDTSQDGFFRRMGLRGLLFDRYRERLAGDAARGAGPVLLGSALGWFGLLKTPRSDGARFLIRLVVSWTIVTILAVLAFAITGWGPPHRVLVFAFFLPLAAAVGVGAAWTAGRVPALAASVAALVFAAVAMFGWFRQSPAFDASDLALARAAGRAISELPPGTPLVFPFDTDEPAAAYHVTAALNVLRMGLPPERIPDAYIGVGTSGEIAFGRAGTNGDHEHDAIARAYAAEIRAATTNRAWYVVVPMTGSPTDFNRVHPTTEDVGFVHVPSVDPRSEEPGLSPLALVALSVAALALLGALGGGWARWMLPGATARAVACAAPAAGIALLAIVGVVGDLVGLDPSGWSGLAASAGVGVVGYVAGAVFRGR